METIQHTAVPNYSTLPFIQTSYNLIPDVFVTEKDYLVPILDISTDEYCINHPEIHFIHNNSFYPKYFG